MKLFILFLLFLQFSCSQKIETSTTINNEERISNTYDTIINTIEYQKVIQYFHNDSLTAQKTFYSTGELQEVEEYINGRYEFKYKYYHKNGTIKKTGEQGFFAGCGMQIGIENNYDTSGQIIEKKRIEHFLPERASGCHETRTVINVTNYYPNGNINKTSQIETCYECEECPCGKWEIYNQEGKITKSFEYGNCYDYHLGCLDD